MSALGQKRTLRRQILSALTPKADIDQQLFDVRFAPEADIRLGIDILGLTLNQANHLRGC